jgi:hypothetical protein
MVSYPLYYAHIQKKEHNRDFFAFYTDWFKRNCLNCEFFNEDEDGTCQAEFKLKILSKKKRAIIYIAIYYDKNYGLCDCLIKPIIKT